MRFKGPLFYCFYCFLTVSFAMQSYFTYRGRAFGEAALYGMAMLSSVGLMLYAFSTRKTKPPAP